jgi:hypothetical protein
VSHNDGIEESALMVGVIAVDELSGFCFSETSSYPAGKATTNSKNG